MSGESRQHYPRLYQETVRSEAAPVLDATNPEAESAPHSRMSCCLEEIRAWAGQVADYGYPHYGEFAARLEAIRDGLVATLPDATLSVPSCSEATGPFQEDIATSRDVVQAPEQVASEVQSELARQSFLQSLDHLVSALHGEDRCFVSWQAACRVFDQLCHEYQQILTGKS